MKADTAPTSTMQFSRHACHAVPVSVEVSRFRGAGGAEEINLTAHPTESGTIEEQSDWLRRGVASLGFDARSALFRRFFCSDLTGQDCAFDWVPHCRSDSDGAICAESWIGQSPESPARVAMWAYHICDVGGPIDKRDCDGTLVLKRGSLHHHWTPGIVSANGDGISDQTGSIFASYERTLRNAGGTLADDVVRTWLFLRDIDIEYGDMARTRRELFAQRGLTEHTHYIASTGIGGSPVEESARIAMDAYAVVGIAPGQISYIRAADHLSATSVYGVTFERATAVAYGDRRHVFVSGTASIDEKGKLLHAGDVDRQLGRTLDNVDALLSEASARREHMGILIAYVRNPEDAPTVRRGIRGRYGLAPLVVVHAPVCRPEWLVEIEGIAIAPATDERWPAF